MAGSDATPKQKRTQNNKKRKQRSVGESRRTSKTHRINIVSEKESEPLEVEIDGLPNPELREPNQALEQGLPCPWRNLELILALRNEKIDLPRKVELAYGFVISRLKEGGSKSDQDNQAVNISRLIIFVNDWIQSLLISSEKKILSGGKKGQAKVIEKYLDLRCWVIFKFCLEESLKLNVSLSFSGKLLGSISLIARSALPPLCKTSSRPKELFSVGECLQFYNTVLDCISLVYSSHGGLSNENLDLWASAVAAVLELVHKFYIENLVSGNEGELVLRFSCLVLEPFAKFVNAHLTQKRFRDFIDKLLEPLLHLLGLLNVEIDGSNPGWTRKLVKLVEDVLSYSLYNKFQIDGFLNLCSSKKYATSNSGKPKDSETNLQSYHRHLFDKLEIVLASKNVLAVENLGELFRLLINQVKKQKRDSVLSESTKMMGKTEALGQLDPTLMVHASKLSSGSSTVQVEKSYCSSGLNAETRKSLLDFFVLIMEPLLLEINGYLDSKLEVGSVLLDVCCTLRSINGLLSHFMHEKVYVRTEDTSEGACLNFLKKVYDMIMSLSSNLIQSSKYGVVNGTNLDTLTSIGNEVLSAVGYLLEIEYEVIENDLVSLWLLMLSYLAIGLSAANVPDQCSLSFKIVDIGCQLAILYSQLRQVNNTIFALCKAIRLLNSHSGDVALNYTRFVISIGGDAYAKSVEVLLCSQDFKIAIQRAINTIPEGQASGCIGQLTLDVSESLEWLKLSCSGSGGDFGKQHVQNSLLGFNLEAELLGRGLSEMYALVLDSLLATTGNCNLLGVSLKKLIAVICPLSSLVGLQPDALNNFLFSVTGKFFDNETAEKKNYFLMFGLSTPWVFVFFFRLYMSCQSLFRSAASLMPPDLSRNMSAAMGDPFASYSGNDWMEMTKLIKGGYFSWIRQPSGSLLAVIESISNIYCKDWASESCPLTYVMHAMAVRRLVDLNRHIKSFGYLMQYNENLAHVRLLDDAGLSRCRKRSKKLEGHIHVLREEAAGLTGFMMEHLSLVAEDQPPLFTSDGATCSKMIAHESDGWDFSVCALNKKSLPTAIWWILCRNIDTWCTHATKKDLKIFLSLLINTSLPCVRIFGVDREHDNHEAHRLKKVTLHQISSECFLDSILYEQKFVHKYFASSFCHALEKSTFPFISDISSGNIDFKSTPNWLKILHGLENSSVIAGSFKEHNIVDSSSAENLATHSDALFTGSFPEQKSFPSTAIKFTACQSLLNLLCFMPKGHLNPRSFSLYVTSILNLERFLVDGLLDYEDALYVHHYQDLFRLFVSCRKALRYIILTWEEKAVASQTLHTELFCEDSFPVLWLYKSVHAVAGLQKSLSKDSFRPLNDMILSLMDHTFYVFLIFSKYQSNHAVRFPKVAELNAGLVYEHTDLSESDPCLDPSNNTEAWKCVTILAKSLKEQMQSQLLNLKDGPCNRKVGTSIDVLNLNKFSSLVSCLSGFLWGLLCVVNRTDARNSDHKVNSSRRKLEPFSELNLCINVFTEFSGILLHALVFDNNLQSRISNDAQNARKEEHNIGLLGAEEVSPEGTIVETDIAGDVPHDESTVTVTCSVSSDLHDESGIGSVHRKKSHSKGANCTGTSLTDVDSFECQSLNKPLLRCLLKGDYPDLAFLLRQLLIASSAILRLSLHMNCPPLPSRLMHIFTGITQVILLESVDMDQVPHFFYFVCLDGVLKYLEELGNYFPLTNPTLSRNLYDKMVQLQLRALGKCITLQGKRATLVSHETASCTKMLHSLVGFSESSLSGCPYLLDELKVRLRSSFTVFIKKPSELHLLSALQAIERSLVGVREGCTMCSDIHTGGVDGGKVSSVVAAGIDCLDLVLESVSGRKRLNVVKRHIQSFMSSIFNVILHLQSPLIFYGRLIQSKGDTDPDPGSVILMCVDILVRISGKHALYQMEAWHVAQSLRIPSALFQDFHLLKFSEASIADISNPVASTYFSGIDREYTMNLFAACCRLLHNVLKHHKSECEPCIAILEASVRALLHCLETVDADAIGKGFFSWEVEEGVKCASCLRRIYEEIRHQKDVFGPHCSQFLSNYIWVYSGYGPRKTGIKREIDEALRPGVYTLIDICSADDLQHLHTVFGEGPCRNTLATLKHDYELNFQYQGKV